MVTRVGGDGGEGGLYWMEKQDPCRVNEVLQFDQSWFGRVWAGLGVRSLLRVHRYQRGFVAEAGLEGRAGPGGDPFSLRPEQRDSSIPRLPRSF